MNKVEIEDERLAIFEREIHTGVRIAMSQYSVKGLRS